jgi:hypothetical protein
MFPVDLLSSRIYSIMVNVQVAGGLQMLYRKEATMSVGDYADLSTHQINYWSINSWTQYAHALPKAVNFSDDLMPAVSSVAGSCGVCGCSNSGQCPPPSFQGCAMCRRSDV